MQPAASVVTGGGAAGSAEVTIPLITATRSLYQYTAAPSWASLRSARTYRRARVRCVPT